MRRATGDGRLQSDEADEREVDPSRQQRILSSPRLATFGEAGGFGLRRRDPVEAALKPSRSHAAGTCVYVCVRPSLPRGQRQARKRASSSCRL